MKLIKLSISNFRSIKKAQNIDISDMTVLIGKNNEGKSNFLSALAICLNTLYGRRYLITHRDEIFHNTDANSYNWKRDFPVSLQNKKGASKTTLISITLTFSNKDILLGRKETGLELPKIIEIKTKYSKNDSPIIKTSDTTINKKLIIFQRFLAENIALIYIPAVRTPSQAKRVINDTIYTALSKIKHNPKYTSARKTITDLQKPILDGISSAIKKQLSEFLPEIKSVKIDLEEEERFFSRYTSSFDIIIDDGNPTSIDYKGDGIKSLAVLGILKNSKKFKELSIVAIEEPESHLHPGAIKQLRNMIQSLENTNQIVLTTHSPLFINKSILESNIVINDKSARNAKSISEIRDMLGVVVDDNLAKAKYIILVEGESDKRILTSLLCSQSRIIKKTLDSGDMAVEVLHGASKLAQMYEHARTNLCDVFAIIDNDIEGRGAISSALDRGVLGHRNYSLIKCRGKEEAELEDLLQIQVYKDAILNNFGVDISKRIPKLKISNKKWSKRMELLFNANGKLFDSDVEKQLKTIVADCVCNNPRKALLTSNKPLIDNIIASLKDMINQ